MFFKSLDLTTALRPELFPDEALLFVQDAVGLYEGKYKIPNYQNGHAYLTSHRICYVSVDEPRKYSVGIDLKDVDRAEYQAGFLKSSPKITLYPKPSKNFDKSASAGTAVSSNDHSPRPQPLATHRNNRSPKRLNATWICPICSFSNPVPPEFDPSTANTSTDLRPCLACGIRPPFTTVLKAAVAAAASRDPLLPDPLVESREPLPQSGNGLRLPFSPSDGSLSCSRCTFINHPSLPECEICGAPLTPESALSALNGPINGSNSPAPLSEQASIQNVEVTEVIKLSFRGGGEKIFLERLKGALIQRKWLLYNAPPVPQPSESPSPGPSLITPTLYSPSPAPPRPTAVGIAGLEQRGLEARRNNEVVIGNAFEDLEALMASAKQIVALAETLARESGITSTDSSPEANAVISESATALGMVTTKDMLGSGAESLYLSELSRNLAEYLTDDRKGILHREGGIMSLIDLWAVFNRSRNGVELVSPSDFQRAAELWEKLKLPVRLRRFKSGLLIVQRHDWTDEKTIRQLQSWMEELRRIPPDEPVPWDWSLFGRSVTAQEAAQRFKWSVGVAAEELEMAEDKGILCREEGIEGLRFWSNHITDSDVDLGDLGIAELSF